MTKIHCLPFPMSGTRQHHQQRQQHQQANAESPCAAATKATAVVASLHRKLRLHSFRVEPTIKDATKLSRRECWRQCWRQCGLGVGNCPLHRCCSVSRMIYSRFGAVLDVLPDSRAMLLYSSMCCSADGNTRILHVFPHTRTMLLDSICGTVCVVLDTFPDTWGMVLNRIHRVAPMVDHVTMHNLGRISNVVASLTQMVVRVVAESLKPFRSTMLPEMHRERNTQDRGDQATDDSCQCPKATNPIFGTWINKVPFFTCPSTSTLASEYVLWYAMM
mmetsp:Transcript_39941/g.79000  ORF Transcript_39941/g.79000 Transcript_39941/m.79000 type:complete len:275 (+) Transcript_39941:121-945(+)